MRSKVSREVEDYLPVGFGMGRSPYMLDFLAGGNGWLACQYHCKKHVLKDGDLQRLCDEGGCE